MRKLVQTYLDVDLYVIVKGAPVRSLRSLHKDRHWSIEFPPEPEAHFQCMQMCTSEFPIGNQSCKMHTLCFFAGILVFFFRWKKHSIFSLLNRDSGSLDHVQTTNHVYVPSTIRWFQFLVHPMMRNLQNRNFHEKWERWFSSWQDRTLPFRSYHGSMYLQFSNYSLYHLILAISFSQIENDSANFLITTEQT